MKFTSIPLEAFGSTVSVGDLIASGSSLQLRQGRDGQLWARQGGEETAVVAHCCFPWSAPGTYVSLRDHERNEVALIRDPAALDERSRAALEWALAGAAFVFTIEAIEEVEDEIEIRRWHVRTVHGPRAFQTGRDVWPEPMSAGGYLIRDVAGDLYHVPNPATLDRRSRDLLWAFAE